MKQDDRHSISIRRRYTALRYYVQDPDGPFPRRLTNEHKFLFTLMSNESTMHVGVPTVLRTPSCNGAGDTHVIFSSYIRA
jgi:hypothetical protein